MSTVITILERYFDAWRDHDVFAISNLFSRDAEYDIGPRRRVLRNLQEIEAYWKRNTARQAELHLEWSPLSMDVISSVMSREGQAVGGPADACWHCGASFSAEFFDTEERERQRVEGVLCVEIEEDGRIARLWETYTKKTLPATKEQSLEGESLTGDVSRIANDEPNKEKNK